MTKVIDTFRLDPPIDDATSDMGDFCHWIIQVIDKDDKALPFVVSIYTSFLKYGGLTDKQAASLMDVFSRVQKQFDENRLTIQGCIGSLYPDGPVNVVTLADLKKGRS